MNTQDRFDLYIEGLLNKKEMQELEDQFKINPVFYEEFKEYSKVNQMVKNGLASALLDCKGDLILEKLSLQERLMIEEDISDYMLDPKLHALENENNFRELLKSLINKSKIRKKNKFLSLIPIIKIAAIVVLVFLSSILIIKIFGLPIKQLSAVQIFQKYYDPVNDKSLKPYGTLHVIMRKAIVAFRNEDFAGANSSLDMISKDYDTEYMYHIMKGLILLEEGKLSDAKEYFKTAMDEADTDSRFIGKWYLGLTLLKENNVRDALALFDDLSKVNNPYKKSAKRILKTVKQE